MYSDSLLARLTPLFAVMTLPAGILAAVYLGLSAAITVLAVGWLLLTPASAILFGAPTPSTPPDPPGTWDDDEVEAVVQERIREKMRQSIDEESSADPVEELRQRYARGEIDEVELERRLDALLETEDVDPGDEESIERAKRNIGADERAGDPAAGSDSAPEDTELAADRE